MNCEDLVLGVCRLEEFHIFQDGADIQIGSRTLDSPTNGKNLGDIRTNDMAREVEVGNRELVNNMYGKDALGMVEFIIFSMEGG